MKLTREERQYIADLYEKANLSDTAQDWQNVNTFFEEMGEKYGFSPEIYIIDTRGNIYKRKDCYICNGVANTFNQCLYDKTKPICYDCFAKKFPEKVSETMPD